ncbi:hypothetical protein JQU17_00510 [Ponticoccus sp. SC2-23]|uniref:hypothetical protein n=1 Tax=Alexandriicola marinus TaxID=2081710 RepID=UPI0013DEAF8F|nr:hypothetical protein [Alexandriicola marinus]MBM1218660.1 hypothetical protein [Ponticoccus sp. SC6-9]MBM1224268.1 hypothetical protein [Ponticoccus sp. SC6-15]MBM1229953.1 hypothetical protein [Ponticoccus sp. SC6-38]MBM1233234.1 hypothetical protein [Ponticoccus sp. SC6-45]MBM1236816.1 hypothetical protein [Ponticoccus sp. SC6-49]MBM1242245.1 hypothetical protein [Ponticoccus sp. SC2-64]MBM1246758.1 hypothetical protein [Ponticoccus sp. SC6-42]MBM1251236.1 hypothetical protein [Pontico
MAHTEAAFTVGGGAGTWILRLLLVAAAALMVYSWFQPWWIGDIATIRGTDDLVLHPWGIDAVGPVRMASDPALYEMPGFFKPFVWTYFGVAMLALLASLFVNMKFKLGPVRLPLATTLILLVGLSYLITVGLAYFIGDMRASGLDMNFIGRSDYTDPTSHRKVRMDSALQDGYWYALYAGVALFSLAIIRFLFLREWRK